MIVAGDVEFPDDCPVNCPEKEQPFYQGNPCCRCPIFNCRKVDTPDGDFCLCEPEGYRHDWAVEWKKWFDEGMKGLPYLPLSYEGKKQE